MNKLTSAIACILIVLCACNDFSSIDEAKWELQLDSVIESQKDATNKKLTLENYSLHKKISTTKELTEGLDELFADTSRIALQNYNDLSFEIYTIMQVRNSSDESLRSRFNFDILRKELFINTNLYLKQKIGNLYLIKLEWAYNGNIFYSTALANKELGILFGTVGYMIIADIIDKKDYSVENRLVTDMSADDEGSKKPGKKATKVTIKKTTLSKTAKAFFGNEIAHADYSFESTFNNEGLLINRSSESKSNVGFGFLSSCRDSFSSGTLYSSNHNTYEWIWFCYSGNAPHLSDNIMCIDSGSETHTADMPKVYK